MDTPEVDVHARDLAFAQQSHRASLAALHSATVLRFARATLLFCMAGAIIFVVVVPFCLATRTKWWGIECGPTETADAELAMANEELKSIGRKVYDSKQWQDVISAMGARVEGLANRFDFVARRTLVDGCSFSVVCPQTDAAEPEAPQVAVVHVEPVESDEYGAVMAFNDRWFYPDDLNGREVVVRGTRMVTTAMRFRVTWVGRDGTSLDQATALFSKTAGKWDKYAQVVSCDGVNAGERLSKVQIIRLDSGQ